VEGHAAWIGDINYEKRRYEMNGGLRNVEMEKNKEISWTEHITNEELLTMIREERAMIRTIRKRQKKIHWTLT